jgi:Mg2+-importing ATPase
MSLPGNLKQNGGQSEHERFLVTICSKSQESALSELNSRLTGLSGDYALKYCAEHGRNVLPIRRPTPFPLDLLERFKNPLVIQLLAICAVSVIMGDMKAVAVVGGMIFISVFLSYFQEKRSDAAVRSLRKMVRSSVIALRDNIQTPIDIEDIARGDIVVLSAGSIIPADLRILSAKDFFINQSSLTGESLPVEKNSEPDARTKEALELTNAAFQGSTVLSGTARGLVVNTGDATVLGRISRNITKVKAATAFDKGVQSFVWLMVRFMIIMVLTTFLIVGITKHNWIEALLFALSVAVGLTPEMLPMIMTVCLSKGALTMSRKKVIIKKLKSIQNLGSMNILCTDKTGTLTQDRVVLEKHVDVTGRQSDDVLKYAYMNSYYQTGLLNLLDKAILAHDDLDMERDCRKVDEIPFDFHRKRMSVIIDYEDTHVLICKGAVENVYPVCDQYQVDDEIYPLIDFVKNDLIEDYKDLSAEGYRVLAIAYREFPRTKEVFSSADEQGMVLLGYIAFFDPPKDSALEAVQSLAAYGVEVKILTGDNELVTKKVCKDIGLEVKKTLVGPEMSLLSEKDLAVAVLETTVFARLSPSQKETVIQALRNQGNVVGFMGDGINDAPALHAADVGISVDSAVDVAKESADIILLERSLLVLRDGIVEGRKVFANIIKYIRMGASSNFGNMFSVVGGSYFLPFLPMAPIQILANNLLYDISQTGIPSDNVDEELIRSPRKWDIREIRQFMMYIGPVSSIFDYATFFLMLYFYGAIHFKDPGISSSMRGHYEALFHTGWFVESLLTQTLIVHIIRTRRIPILQSRASAGMSISTLAVMAIAVALPYSPAASLLGLVPLPASFWCWIAAFLLSYGVITHIVKKWFDSKHGGSRATPA